MNRPIARLFFMVLVMFALLVVFTSRWTVFDQKALQANPLNRRPLIESQRVKRGSIYADNGAVLADSVRPPDGVYSRRYPFGRLFAAPIGYAFPLEHESAGLEEYRNNVLSGTPVQQESIVHQLEGVQASGDNVYTTLDPTAQRVAVKALKATHLSGAVVAMVPGSGAIKVFAGSPTYDPNLIPDPKALARSEATGSSQVDLVTQAEYAPGSIQKVVTAITAIDSGQFTPTSIIDGSSPQTFEGIPLSNDSGTSYGNITLTEALTNSVNTVYADVGQKLGGALLAKYMSRLGYYRRPPIDLPSDELTPSGVRSASGNLIPPTGNVDVPLMAIGEGHLLVTPLQMVMVAAAVANKGRLMTPYLTNYVTNADGSTILRSKPSLYHTVMKSPTAVAVGAMMQDVVQDGTAEAALQGFDIPVAGKTGTAQDCDNSSCDTNQVWFIAYAPATNPKVAVAVTLAHSTGYGGSVAAPIARQVIQTILDPTR